MNDNKAIAIFFVASFSMLAIVISIMTYSDGKTKQMEIQLKIEQEKTKQNEGKDWKYKDY